MTDSHRRYKIRKLGSRWVIFAPSGYRLDSRRNWRSALRAANRSIARDRRTFAHANQADYALASDGGADD